MYKTIGERDQIEKYQNIFQQKIIELSDGKSNIRLGYQSGSGEVVCYWFEGLDFWIAFGMETTNSGEKRYWNSFGFSIEIPEENSTETIISQMNIKCEGIDRRTAASYAINENGEIGIIHRGVITLNPHGKINSYFDQYYSHDELVRVKDGQDVYEYALVCELESEQIIEQLYNFTKFVNELKDQVRVIKSENISTSSAEPEQLHFLDTDEPTERASYQVSKTYNPRTNHALVYYFLKNALKTSNSSLDIRRTQQIDLLILNQEGEATHVFEIKSSSELSKIYKAIGQLYLNSIQFEDNPKLILVVPIGIDDDLEGKLRNISIDLLKYKINQRKVEFVNFDKYFN